MQSFESVATKSVRGTSMPRDPPALESLSSTLETSTTHRFDLGIELALGSKDVELKILSSCVLIESDTLFERTSAFKAGPSCLYISVITAKAEALTLTFALSHSFD